MNNALKVDRVPREIAAPFIKLLSPIAPHLGEELWQRLNAAHWTGSIAAEPWPTYDERSRWSRRSRSRCRSTASSAAACSWGRRRQGRQSDGRRRPGRAKIAAELAGKTVRKVVCIPGRMVNIVAN